MKKNLIITLLSCCGCTKNLSSDSVVVDLSKVDTSYYDKDNFYIITEEPSFWD